VEECQGSQGKGEKLKALRFPLDEEATGVGRGGLVLMRFVSVVPTLGGCMCIPQRPNGQRPANGMHNRIQESSSGRIGVVKRRHGGLIGSSVRRLETQNCGVSSHWVRLLRGAQVPLRVRDLNRGEELLHFI
jgi:hypothetical protein